MVITAHSFSELSFGKLMEIYVESNLETGRKLCPHASANLQLLTAEQDFYAYLQDCFFRTEGAVYCVWEESGQYVSALRLEAYQDGLLVSALETTPQKRNRGFAKKLLCAVCCQLQAPCTLYAHVKKDNIASLRVHEAGGFTRILEYGAMLDGSVNARYCTLKKTVSKSEKNC